VDFNLRSVPPAPAEESELTCPLDHGSLSGGPWAPCRLEGDSQTRCDPLSSTQEDGSLGAPQEEEDGSLGAPQEEASRMALRQVRQWCMI
jgi:hypothetical protein